MVDVADAIDRHFERVGGDPRKDRFDALTNRRRAEIDRECPVIVDFEPRRLFRTGGAALDETGNAETMIAAINQSPAQLRLLVPADFLEALIERSLIFAAVVLILGV